MSQTPIYEIPVLNAGDDFEGPTTAIANFNVDADGRPMNMRLSRWIQDIAACRSAGERTAAPT